MKALLNARENYLEIKLDNVFDKDDHRSYNRNGEFFDKGETLSGVDFGVGIQAVDELKRLFSGDNNLATYALRWILMFDAISCVIPGASSIEQAQSNVAASGMAPLSTEQMQGVKEVYERYIKKDVHQLW